MKGRKGEGEEKKQSGTVITTLYNSKNKERNKLFQGDENSKDQ